MPHTFTNAEYADVAYIYGFCDGSARAAVEYRRRLPMHRIPDRRMFSKVFDILLERGKLPSDRVSPEPACQHHVKGQENILEMVQHSPTTDTRRPTRLGVSRTHVIARNLQT
jgi:hypothetical protein